MDKRIDVAVAAGVSVIGLVMLVAALLLPEGSIRDPLGPHTMPAVVGGLLVVGGIFLAMRRLVVWRSTPVQVPEEGSEDLENYSASAPRAFLVWGICLAYAILIGYVGFLILTPFLFAGLLWILHFRKVLPVVLISALGTAAIYGIFDVILLVRLPHGPLTGII